MDSNWLKRTAFEMAVIAAILFGCTMLGLRVYDKLSDFHPNLHAIIQIGLSLVIGVGSAVAFIGMFILRHDEDFWKNDTWIDRLWARLFKSTPTSDEAAPDERTLH